MSAQARALDLAQARKPGWYVVETLPRCEAQAAMHLERQGFQPLCPRFRKARRHARRIDHVLAPLFPGYMFVQFDPQWDHWTAINGTIGVRRLVGASLAKPQAMPKAAMDAVLARCKSGVMHTLMPGLVPGQQVRLVSGPFSNELAIVERLDDRGRVRVLLEILGGQVAFDTHAEILGPVGA